MESGIEHNPAEWIRCDETAAEALARAALERPALLPPPLHRVPLRPGNVVEIVGPSPSAKSEILIQARSLLILPHQRPRRFPPVPPFSPQTAISCILPREWRGRHLGGMDRLVVYFDLDCRFNVLRLAHCLKGRLARAQGDGMQDYGPGADRRVKYDEELFQTCMRRFLYIRCYNSLEFLAALKTLRFHIQKEIESQGVGVYFLMIDSISAFYWMDRACQPPSVGTNKRKSFSFQSIMEAIVNDIQKFLQAQKAIVFATKSTILGLDASSIDAKWAYGRSSKHMTNSRISSRDTEKNIYREFMPSVWQVLVSHRMCIQVPEVTDENIDDNINTPMYMLEWIKPPLNLRDKFTVTDVGIVITL